MDTTEMRQSTPDEGVAWLFRALNRMILCRDTDALLDVAYDTIRAELGYDRVGILLVDPTGRVLLERVGTDETGRKTSPAQDTALARERALYRAPLLADPRLQVDGPGYIYGRDMFRDIPPAQRRLLDGRPTQNVLVALRTANATLGLISVDNLVTGRPIEESDAPALMAFANALATAIENVTLLEERGRRIDDLDATLRRRVVELEWLRDISRKVNAARSLDDALDVVYDAIRDGLGYDRVGIQLFDYHIGWWQDMRGTDAQGRRTRPSDRIVVSKDDIRWRSPDLVALMGGADYYYTDDVYAVTPPELRHMLDGAPKHNLNVPLRSGDSLIGIISVDNLLSGRPISPADVGPLLTISGHVGAAVDNARLQDKERAERLRLEALLESARVLNSTLDADHILHTLAARLVTVLGAAAASFCRVDPTTRRCATLAYHHAPAYRRLAALDGARASLDEYPALERVLTTRDPLHVYVEAPDCPPSEAALLHRHDLGAEILVPVTVHGVATGVLEVYWAHASERISAETQDLCTALAEQAAVALHNAHLYAEVAERAERDPLTGLPHHRAFIERFDAALATQTPLALLLLDVDNFKLFNDTYGHLTGDAVLHAVAGILRELCREDDVAARYGGDEFALLLPGAAMAEARAVADRLTAAIRACSCPTAEGISVPLSGSVGVALYPSDGMSRPELIAVADAAMYAAKRGEEWDGAIRGKAPAQLAGRPYRRAADLLGETPLGVLEGLVGAVDAKDRYTRVHSDEVTRLALLLAEELGLGADERRALALAGPLHDVGKIAVPDRVLRKPGPLSVDETALVRRHVAYGVAIIRGVLPDDAVLDAVAAHHERWDGEGYPAGRRGPDSPLLGRLMQVADAVSAMRLDRPYRKGLAPADIIAELRNGAGAQFDPALVEPCIAILSGRRLDAAS